MKIKLTQSMFPKILQCPEGKTRIELCDADCPGLYIEVRASSPGEGTVYFRYKDEKKKNRHKRLGSIS